MPVYSLGLDRINVSLAGIPLEGYEADREFTVVSEAHHMPRPLNPDCVAPFGECACDNCLVERCHLLDAYDPGEFVREDIAEAVYDALILRKTPADYEANPFDFLGYSDPVHLAPLELRF
jgi:hypothetical protein